MALTSNDCCRMDESALDPVGRTGPVCVKGLYRFGLAPGLESTLPYHTNGMRPVKIPLPPRTWVRRPAEALPVKPLRGGHRGVVPRRLLWSAGSGEGARGRARQPRAYRVCAGLVEQR